MNLSTNTIVVTVQTLLCSMAKPLFVRSMKDFSAAGDRAFETWWELRDAASLLASRGSLDLSRNERARMLAACGCAHDESHEGSTERRLPIAPLDGAVPVIGVNVCGCYVACNCRLIAGILGRHDVDAAIAARRSA